MARLAVLLAALFLVPAPAPAMAESLPKVAVTAIVEHPALDAVRDGLKAELAAAGFTEGTTLRWSYESAQGNPATAAQIARKLVGERPAVIVPISTPSAQAAAAATRTIPIVFSAVTDPVAARLVASWDKPGGNVTGVSDLAPIAKHLDLIREIAPGVRRLGVVYNPGEANAVSLLDLIKAEAPAKGMVVVTAASPRSSDVLMAARSLIGKADAFYVGTDNTVVSGLEALVKVAVENQIPFFAGDTDSVPRGAAAAVGFNYYDVGRQTGQVVARILKGEAPAAIPVQGVEITQLWLNPKSAQRQGLSIPNPLLNRADKVID